MSHISRTPKGNYRANWREPSGRQRAKTFPSKREAAVYLAEIGASLNRGTYISPTAGKTKFGPYAKQWLAARNVERTTADKDMRVMNNHVLPRWETVPLSKIDHSAVQAWVSSLGARLAPATVGQCFRMASNVLRCAVRDRLIGLNPCDGVRLPKQRKRDTDNQVLTRAEVARLLPMIPDRYRALVALSAGTGLRWGECLGLRWDCIDLKAHVVKVVRVATEVNGHVQVKPYPKSRAGRRNVPMPTFLVEILIKHRQYYANGPAGEVFTNSVGGPLRRSMFRSRVWRPALVRAGLLGKVIEHESGFRAERQDSSGVFRSEEFASQRDAVRHVARTAAGGVRFHDLRHSYATWLVSSGVPVNDVQQVMGHERASTTLDLYTHMSQDWDSAVRGSFADFPLTPEENDEPDEDDSGS
jgi:integrase